MDTFKRSVNSVNCVVKLCLFLMHCSIILFVLCCSMLSSMFLIFVKVKVFCLVLLVLRGSFWIKKFRNKFSRGKSEGFVILSGTVKFVWDRDGLYYMRTVNLMAKYL
jgi:hypothetical protein